MEKRDGFIPFYLDDRTGAILLEIPRDSMRALMLTTLATGLGSNPIGLDRGSGGGEQVARFERSADRVLVIFENTQYRSSGGADNLRTVLEAFPPSTIAALPIVAEEGGRILVDATDFVMRDWNDVASTLQRSQQGAYTVARDRSHVYKPYTKAFPDNTEIDVALTWAANANPGGIVSRVAPDGKAITLRQHITLMRLPDDNFKTRAADPRVGYFGVSFKDYDQPIQGSLEQTWVDASPSRAREPERSEHPIKNPIVYYIDRGIPEPMRTATFQGVSWWAEAFDRAGLKGAFKVEWLPEGADPMDVRYNVVQWENRNERGWSVGGALTDPRTGEMLKGMARLDSHRARTDYNIYAAFMGADPSPADTAFVLARVRQVSAHEVGHTLGLGHNYIASTYERASVMDYPAPRVLLTNGRIDLSQAYGVGPGAYDVWAIHWGYGIFPTGRETDSLKAIVADGLKKGYLYLSDADARPDNAADPRTNLWDDAATPGDFFKHQVDVRRFAMAHFGLRNVRDGDPLALLQDRFPLLYFFHRFAINSVTKTIGGMEYANPLKGDGQQATRPIGGARQREALASLLAELQPSELAIPDTVLDALPAALRREQQCRIARRAHDARVRRTRRGAYAVTDDHRRHSAARTRRAARGVRVARRESADARRDDRQARRRDMERPRSAERQAGRAAAYDAARAGRPSARARRGQGCRAGSSRDGGVQDCAAAREGGRTGGCSRHGRSARALACDRRRFHTVDRAERAARSDAGTSRAAGRSIRRAATLDISALSSGADFR